MPRLRVDDVAWPDSVIGPGDSTPQFGHQHEPPKRVKLLLEPNGRGLGVRWYALEPGGPDTLSTRGTGERGWRVADRSVIAFWSTGFVGVRLNMVVTDFGLEGTAVATSDIVGPFPIRAARVTLIRTRCRD